MQVILSPQVGGPMVVHVPLLDIALNSLGLDCMRTLCC